jgi:hypothetical protein
VRAQNCLREFHGEDIRLGLKELIDGVENVFFSSACVVLNFRWK